MIAPGDCEGRAIQGKVQFGESESGSLQIAIDMELRRDGKIVGEMTTFLYFTDKSIVYAYERLRLLGWKGQGPQDIDNLGNIYQNWVPCQVKAPEQYKDSAGVIKMGSAKLEIVTSAGTVTLSKPLDVNTFKARLAALGGGGGGSAPASGGGSAPPF